MNLLFPVASTTSESVAKTIDKLNLSKNHIAARQLMVLVFGGMSVSLAAFVIITGQSPPHFSLTAIGLLILIALVSFGGNVFDYLSLKSNDLSLREPLFDFESILAGLVGYIVFPSERKPLFLIAFIIASGVVYWGSHRRKLQKSQKTGMVYLLLAVMLYAVLPSLFKATLSHISPDYIALFRTVAVLGLTIIFFPIKKRKTLTKRQVIYGLASSVVYAIGTITALYAIQKLGVVETMLVLLLGPFLRYNYYTMKPIYAGINREKWTNDKPIKTKFDGLVSVDLFNKANHGKIVITFDEQGEPSIATRQPALHLTSKNVDNPEFAYRKYISCPNCYKTLLGSASKGKMGKYYAAYHCSNHGHYWREPNAKFEESINDFIDRVSVSPERVEELMEAIHSVHEQQTVRVERDVVHIASRRAELETQIKVIVDKLKLISSPTAIKYMEEDLLKIEAQIVELDGSTQAIIKKEESINMNAVLQGVKYYMEHLKELLLTTVDKNNKAAYFGVLFNMVPSYDKISNRTLKMSDIPELNEVFQLANDDSGNMVSSRGIELS